jgi:hypothetical protein
MKYPPSKDIDDEKWREDADSTSTYDGRKTVGVHVGTVRSTMMLSIDHADTANDHSCAAAISFEPSIGRSDGQNTRSDTSSTDQPHLFSFIHNKYRSIY